MRRLTVAIGPLAILFLLALLVCGCDGPAQTEAAYTGTPYLVCVDAQAAVHWLGICDERCQADCWARVIEDYQ